MYPNKNDPEVKDVRSSWSWSYKVLGLLKWVMRNKLGFSERAACTLYC